MQDVTLTTSYLLPANIYWVSTLQPSAQDSKAGCSFQLSDALHLQTADTFIQIRADWGPSHSTSAPSSLQSLRAFGRHGLGSAGDEGPGEFPHGADVCAPTSFPAHPFRTHSTHSPT